MERKQIVDPKSYKQFAGASWPTYEEFIAGVEPNDPIINQELNEFIDVMRTRYNNLRLDDGTKLAQENQLRQGQIFYAKRVAGLGCRVPWETMGINSNGEVFVCHSPTWVPKFVGNIREATDIYSILNSDIAQDIRREIANNRYYYCNNTLCSFFANKDPQSYAVNTQDTEPSPRTYTENLLVTEIPKNLIFDFDYTCNFKCPSCRTELINWNDHHLIRPINNQIADKIKHLVIDQIGDQPITIRWAGGEPFISEVYLDIFSYIIQTGKLNIQNVIQTNGSYLRSKVVTGLLPYISELRISFDAGTAETYAKTRVNGNWHKLLENVRYIKEQIEEVHSNTRLTADFVVQADNYHEIPEFVRICNELGINNINLQKMWNWGTWSAEEFARKNIYNSEHPDYEKLKQAFADAGQQILN